MKCGSCEGCRAGVGCAFVLFRIESSGGELLVSAPPARGPGFPAVEFGPSPFCEDMRPGCSCLCCRERGAPLDGGCFECEVDAYRAAVAKLLGVRAPSGPPSAADGELRAHLVTFGDLFGLGPEPRKDVER